jgi:hypothetical protein
MTYAEIYELVLRYENLFAQARHWAANARTRLDPEGERFYDLDNILAAAKAEREVRVSRSGVDENAMLTARENRQRDAVPVVRRRRRIVPEPEIEETPPPSDPPPIAVRSSPEPTDVDRRNGQIRLDLALRGVPVAPPLSFIEQSLVNEALINECYQRASIEFRTAFERARNGFATEAMRRRQEASVPTFRGETNGGNWTTIHFSTTAAIVRPPGSVEQHVGVAVAGTSEDAQPAAPPHRNPVADCPACDRILAEDASRSAAGAGGGASAPAPANPVPGPASGPDANAGLIA